VKKKKALWWLMGLVDDVIFGLDGMGWDGMVDPALKHAGG